MSNTSMQITVKLFAAYQEAYDKAEVVWEFPAGTTAKEILVRCLEEHPKLEQWRELTRFGVNLQFVEPDTVLRDGDEVVLIPPVSGGVGGDSDSQES
ncbi:MoaD/ThiS family protein [Oscillatoriales cyanobacterium LEGE 11467]|uniref:Molybdopterin synthase sulfur carrier subunit n=1 Tax=Zarconia navalis LEGE 11467 TaxID=1828826 RepID=A0A928Z8Q2_9CYAN|nr:MoaD/ThiS family protein [Zarconia navalis]MBE9040061.1 MoaD/ThiS family protein [Zarconia navalis LEGE 11467]